MTTTFIISYIVLALIIVGVINLLLIRSRRKAKRQQKEQHFATRQSNQSKFKASDLDRTTDQSSQHTAREEARIDNKDNQNQVSLNKQTEGLNKIKHHSLIIMNLMKKYMLLKILTQKNIK